MAEMFTEGYLREVGFSTKGVPDFTIEIDPVPPFAIEYKEKRYILFASNDLIGGSDLNLTQENAVSKDEGTQANEGDGQKDECADSNEHTDSKDKNGILYDVGKRWKVDVKLICACLSSIVAIKTSHAKCRFEIEDDSNVITAISII